MKRFLLALALLLIPSMAFAQCNGVFPNNTICGNVTGSSNLPRPTSNSVLTGVPGGTNGQIEFNNSGVFGGFTQSGDCTTVTSTGVTTCAKINGNSVPTGVADSQVPIGTGASTFAFSTIPNCPAGIIQYTSATHTFTCTVLTAAATAPRGYISGFTHSNDITLPNTVIDITVGTARDSTNAQTITQNSAFTKSTAAFAVGTGNGCLDTGSIGAASFYYTFTILRTDLASADYLCSLSPTAPTIPTNYTFFRRIGSFKTASSNITAFVQVNDHWYWQTAIRDISTGATVGTTFVNSPAMSVPKVQGTIILGAATFFGAAAITFFIAPTFVTDTVGNGFAYALGTSAGGTIPAQIQVDSSGFFKYRAGTASSTFVFDTAGWIDSL
jgi:hypothetical protein